MTTDEGPPLKVLFVERSPAAFNDQIAEALEQQNVKVDRYFIEGDGPLAYILNYLPLRQRIIRGNVSIVHAHYGLSGMLCVLQRLRPTVISFIGSDIYRTGVRLISWIADRLCSHSVFVEKSLRERIRSKSDVSSVIPLGVRFDTVKPMNKQECRAWLEIDKSIQLILFAASAERPVKNFNLAEKAIQSLDVEVEIIELSGYDRETYVRLLNAGDVLLMTSHWEGSPVTVKEAMACGCPVVSTDVGDVRQVIEDTQGCYITSYEPSDVAEKLKKALHWDGRTDGREQIKRYTIDNVAEDLLQIYQKLLR